MDSIQSMADSLPAQEVESNLDMNLKTTNESSFLNQVNEEFQQSTNQDILVNSIASATIQPEKLVEVKMGPQHFDLIKLIGEGAFGKVFLVRNKLTNTLLGMKVISKKLLKKKNNVQYMRSERDILSKMSHPFIVSLFSAFQTEKKLFLVMDFLAGGELFFHLKRRGLISEAEIRFYLAEITLALEFLHDMGIIHRDLKPENILLRGNGHIALTDFGLAKEANNHEQVRTFCGTSEYMAPEMLTRNGYGRGVDWWALGALCFEMLTGKAPFTAKSEKELFKKIMFEKISCPPFLTGPAISLLRGLLEKDVNKRLGAAKSTMFNIGGITALKQHEFFVGLNWTDLLQCKLTPPIDVTVRYQQPDDNSRGKSPAPFEAAGSSSSEGRGGGSGEGDGGAFGSSRADTDAWTQHFHEGFTQQAISLSILEDAASVSSSTAPSNLNSDDEGDAELYPGFEFVSQPLLYSEEKLRKLDQEAQNRVRALQKRRMLKNKKDEEKATKVATDTAENARLKLKAEAKQRADIEAKRIAQETLAWEIKEREERQRIEKILADHTKQVKLFEEACLEHTAKLEAVRKQTRAIKKKLRDIAQLEEKIAGSTSKITPEQKEKLAAKTELEQRVSDLEYEEEDLMQSPPVAPAPLPSELIAAGTPSIVEDPNSTPNDTNISTSTSVEAASSSGISLVPKESSLETTSKAEVISSPIISTESKASEQPATPATSTISTSIAATALSNEDNNKDKKEAENGKAKSPPPEDEWVDVKTVKSAKKKDRK